MKNIYKVLFVLICSTTLLSAQTPMHIEYDFRVEGACGMCQTRIEKTAKEAGAISAEWDVDTKMLKVVIDESTTKISAIKYAISLAGHDNGNFITPQEIYDDLHGCCKYRPELEGQAEDTQHQDHDVENEAHENEENEEDDGVANHGHVHFVEGFIYEINDKGNKTPLIGASVKLGDTNVGTTTDLVGHFRIDN
ncbi:MAG: hypothetical protein HKO66_07350, partial [Saprospiraceae bacterium]|nr:carboxypeptidase-like regulatory domain-containing protein [Bacteroidia bacterium]NNL92029.1 hypothetical protein [Saprospiraceae bacterium]